MLFILYISELTFYDIALGIYGASFYFNSHISVFLLIARVKGSYEERISDVLTQCSDVTGIDRRYR